MTEPVCQSGRNRVVAGGVDGFYKKKRRFLNREKAQVYGFSSVRR